MGIRCKIRIDYWLPDIELALDWKSTQDARPESFARSIATYHYHRQQAMYLRGLRANGIAAPRFRFVAQEKDGAFDFKVYALSSMDVAEGDADIDVALMTLARCLERDEWPGYPVDLDEVLSRPAWARKSYR
jgi:exodeoxyribonuclease VIII